MKNFGSHIFEITFITGAVLIYYMGHSQDFFETLGGLFGMSLGTIFVGYIPYTLLKNKIHNPKTKVFSVTFFLLNLLVFLASQPW